MTQSIVICTDTWEPQVNGVVRTLKNTVDILRGWGHPVEVIHPYLFHTFRFPVYNDLELTPCLNRRRMARLLGARLPAAVHIATEGPLGLAARRFCIRNGVPFTTWHHTDFPETIRKVVKVPKRWIYGYMRWFHRRSATLMVNTKRMGQKLLDAGFQNLMRVWPGGVNTDQFSPRPKSPRARKVALYVGRIAPEKGLENFLDCRGDYDKVLVGDGAARPDLQRRYPNARFPGVMSGERLVQAFADADVFVFPSKTDTFGLVLIEALACGVPVAAYPVQGPADIVDRDGVGCLDNNLEHAIEMALRGHDPVRCRQLALEYSWENSARKFFGNLSFPESTVERQPGPRKPTFRWAA
jgi:1,2-diacylglycerol 3-alpha-glucosyltransferase/glucuronosyltransferase